MELGGTGEVKRGGRVIQAKTPTAKKGTSGLTVNTQARADRLALSRQVVNCLEERNRRLMEAGQKKDSEASGANKLLEKGLKVLNKCQKIYARIAAGDKVPPEDLRYLEKNDPEGFKLALAMRRPKKHPKEWKSVLDEEDRNGAASETNGDSGANGGTASAAPAEGGPAT